MAPLREREARIAALEKSVIAGGNSAQGRDAADRLAYELKALAVESPDASTRALIDGYLASKTLDGFVNSAGISCRAGIVNALLAMGFPHAMEVSAADLQLTRVEERVPTGIHGTIGVRLMAGLSALWNGVAALIAFIASDDKYHFDPWGMLAGVGFLVAAGHGLATIVLLTAAGPTATVSVRRTLRKNLQILSWMLLLGPAAVGVLSLVRGVDSVPIAFVLVFPFILTAAYVAFHASGIPPED